MNQSEIVQQLSERMQLFAKRLAQEVLGTSTQRVGDVIGRFKKPMTSIIWKNAQEFVRCTETDYVLNPDNTRMYYRKGNSEILLLEFSPHVRQLSFMPGIIKGDPTDKNRSSTKSYVLALPYMNFLFLFKEKKFSEVKLMFCDRPLRNLREQPFRPYLPNVDLNLKICLGRDFDWSGLEEGNLTQQAAYVLHYFWQSTFSNEWAEHFWDQRQHFLKTEETRLTTMEKWAENSLIDPLFVIDNVDWLKTTEETFARVIYGMFVDEPVDLKFQNQIQQELSDTLLTDLSLAIQEGIEYTIEALRPNFEAEIQQILDSARTS